MSPGPFRNLRVSETHVCALKNDHTHDRIGLKGSGGTLVCWGNNKDGQTDAPTVARFKGNNNGNFCRSMLDTAIRALCAMITRYFAGEIL